MITSVIISKLCICIFYLSINDLFVCLLFICSTKTPILLKHLTGNVREYYKNYKYMFEPYIFHIRL